MKKLIFALAIALVIPVMGYSQADKVLKEGYKGFFEIGNIRDFNDYGADRMEFTTSHGFQVNQYLFLGVGVGLNYYNDMNVVGIPIFGQFRVTPSEGKITPYLDAKIGYSECQVEGFYLSPTIGVRCAVGEKCGIYLGVGYSLQSSNKIYYRGFIFDERKDVNAWSIKFGFDF